MMDPAQLGADTEHLIHPSAIIHDEATIGDGVEIGPWAIIGPGVTVGEGTRIGSNVLIDGETTVGAHCHIFHGAVLGTAPQDLKFKGERTRLIVGDRTTIREYATLNRGTAASGETVVGSDCLLMAYTHVAHDCRVGNHVVLSNAVNMAGHVVIEDWAIVGGLTPIHQFVRIGAHAFVGGGSRIPQDIPPYCKAAGNPPKLYGLNSVGLDRRGFSKETRQAIKQAYRLVFSPRLTVTQGLAKAEAEVVQLPEVRQFLQFIRDSDRGVTQG